MSSISRKYDALNAAIFFGGSRRLRARLIDAMDIGPGDAVLELGCGTGQVTEQLVRAGADVTAVDALPEMLERARDRAPSAQFIHGDLTRLDLEGPFDRVVLSFVLHNLDAAGRTGVLRQSRQRLSEGGSVGILDWASPRGRIRAAAWARFLHRIEPSPTVAEILAGCLEHDVVAAGLGMTLRKPVAGGRARILIASSDLPPTTRS